MAPSAATAIASPSPAGPPIGSAQSSRPATSQRATNARPIAGSIETGAPFDVFSERGHAIDVTGDRDGAGRIVSDAVPLPRYATAREARPHERPVAIEPRREDRPCADGRTRLGGFAAPEHGAVDDRAGERD